MTAGTPVLIRSLKYDGSPHRWSRAVRLGQDEHGVWLGRPARDPVHTPTGLFVPPRRSVRLIPHSGNWTAMFNDPDDPFTIYADVCTPPEWDGEEVRYVDLDLDVVRLADGTVRLEDQQEFDAHRHRYGYPADLVRSATAAAAWLQEAMAVHQERPALGPFGPGYRHWLDQMAHLPAG